MKVLITGGAGFIGSNLADRLISMGGNVIIVDNLETGQERNIPKEAEFYNITLGADPISPKTDINLTIDWKSVDVVVHAAASYKDPNNWRQDALTNVVGTVDLIKAMQAHNKTRLIYFQTALVYGLKPPPYPIPLDYPQSPPGSSYAVSKTAAENYIMTSGLDYVSFRLANCYGPRNLSGPVPTFWKKLKAGEQCTVVNTRRDFVFVDDLLDVVVQAVDGIGRDVYHVSSGKDTSIIGLYNVIADEMNANVNSKFIDRTPDDVATILLDPSKTGRDFHWFAKTNLQDGISRAIQYYNEYGVSETYTHLKLEK